MIADKRVLGAPKEIQEVRNAFAAYEAMETWKPWAAKDLLAAHKLLMAGLVDRPGRFRAAGAGVAQGPKIVLAAGGNGDPRPAGGVLRRASGLRQSGAVHHLH